MTSNEQYLDEAQLHINEFEAKPETERLREAYMALENINLAQETNPESRVKLRANVLSLWLRLLQILDRFLDPDFKPNDVPEKFVEPPQVPGGVVLRPGADPALIADPQVRNAYEQAIVDHRTKTEQYRMQIYLRRLDGQIMPRAETFIRNSYTFAPSDREEAKTAIKNTIKNTKRQEILLKACYEID